MPRIDADSLAEHVDQRRSEIAVATAKLAVQHGFGSVTLGAVAKEIGLARNSLYRYVPDKRHLAVLWYDVVWSRWNESAAALDSGGDEPTAAVLKWLDLQFDSLIDPEIRALIDAVADIARTDDGLAELVARRHSTMSASIAAPLRDLAGGSAPSIDVMAAVLGGLARALADRCDESIAGPGRAMNVNVARAALADSAAILLAAWAQEPVPKPSQRPENGTD